MECDTEIIIINSFPLIPEYYPSPAEVVWRYLNHYRIPWDNFYREHLHLTRDIGRKLVPFFSATLNMLSGRACFTVASAITFFIWLLSFATSNLGGIKNPLPSP